MNRNRAGTTRPSGRSPSPCCSSGRSIRFLRPRRDEGHDVDYHGIARYGDRTERKAMDDPQDDEKRQRPGEQVACENRRKNEERDQVERLARERVEQITRKGTDRQGGYRIAGERDARPIVLPCGTLR